MLLDKGAQAGRRPDAVPRGRDRRARAEIRRRHRHARSTACRSASSSTSTAALLRRGRGLLAQALRDLGPAGRAAAGPDRLLIIDAKSIDGFMPPVFPPIAGRHDRASSRGKLELDPAALEATVDEFNAAVRPGTFDHTDARRLPHRRPRRRRRATGRGRSTRRRSTAIRCGPASPSPISASR